ncbi:uncharacterized protein LOC135390864 [Ornithodoros turicata]|uniref:uncharacterized protein LOC135390864 n=1 Tax=Ornithodoros turicata TaxID=34597 RepID=UPI0031394853
MRCPGLRHSNSTMVFLLGVLFSCGVALAADGSHRMVPLGPKGRVIRDCEWRYRYSNSSDSVLDCKKCVKEYEMRFPPRRTDVLHMRQQCVKPYTPKEAANILCHLLTTTHDERDSCILCIDSYPLPPNATKLEQREMDWNCAPHQPATQLLLSECRYRFSRRGTNLTNCVKCISQSGVGDDASFTQFRKVQSDCITKPDPKERIKRLCKWRFIEESWAKECEQCIDEYSLPSNYDYDDVQNLRQRCVPKPTRKELLKKTCDWYYRGDRMHVSRCERCVEMSDLRESSTYTDEAEVRTQCMPRKPARERVKDACPRRFRNPMDIENCRRCADDLDSDKDENSIGSVDVQKLYRTCLSGKTNYKAQVLGECRTKLEEEESVRECQSCIQSRYHWRIPKELISEARQACLLELIQDN